MLRLFSAAFFLMCCSYPVAEASRTRERVCGGSFCYQPQTTTHCLDPEVWAILHRFVTRVGQVEITSGCNGVHARNSFHYKGMAVDFRSVLLSQKRAMEILQQDPGVRGLIAEPRGLIHADLGRRGPYRWVSWQTHGPRRTLIARHRHGPPKMRLAALK